MARFFINRPIFAIVVSLVLTFAGVIAMVGLPVAQYPQIVLPTVNVTATYPGASAEIVEQAVAQAIEQQVNGIDGMLYMDSNSSGDGTYSLNATFSLENNVDLATVKVQNRVAQATALLPVEVLNAGITTKKQSPDTLMFFALYSPKGSYDELFLKNYGSINVVEVLKRIKGVGNVNEYGSDFGMRIWLKPDQMARLRITPSDVYQAVREQNVQAPAGQIGQYPSPKGQSFAYTVQVRGRLTDPSEFENIIVRSQPDGSYVRIKDIGRVELAAKEYRYKGTLNKGPAAVFTVNLTPDASAIETADLIKAQLAELSKRFPPDLRYVVVRDSTDFVKRSLHEVALTFAEALFLVIIVVYLFLQSWRATLIPMLAVPVSLIGTFAAFTLMGFSINTLTLFAMVLAIGIVVDDAIVVVEAVEYHMHHGLPPRDATLKAMSEVSGPVVAIALVLTAVFVPVAFLGGISGQLYKQFALTIAVSVLLSAFVALSLTPALCALMLKPDDPSRPSGPLRRFHSSFNHWFERVTARYTSSVRVDIRRSALVMVTLTILCVAVVLLMRIVPSGFVPEEDQGYFLGSFALPEASSFERTKKVADRIEEAVRKLPGVEATLTITGLNILNQASQPNTGLFLVRLKPWEERKAQNLQLKAIMGAAMASLAKIPEAMVLTFNPPPIPGMGNTGGFSFMLQDRAGVSPAQLGQMAEQLVTAARKRPEIGMVYSKFNPNTPAYRLEVDREKVKKLGLPLSDVFNALQTFLGGLQINDFSAFGRTYRVVMQAEPEYRTDIKDIDSFFVRSSTGDMIPLGTLVRPESTNAPVSLKRYNIFRTAEIGGVPAAGYSSGQAIRAMEEVAVSVLPGGYGYEWAGISRQEKESAGKAPVVFGLALVFVFLFLAALYESWAVPFAVLFAVPLGIFGAMLFLWLRGFANDVYAQIGLIMLIGLAAKNAILIVEFAKVRHDKGMNLPEAAVEAAKIRLRPILMTSLAFIFGVFPLVRATGAGAAARNALGTAVFGGMTIATALGIFVVPVLFVVVQRLVELLRRPAPARAEKAEGEHP